jgi:adenylate cyclase
MVASGVPEPRDDHLQRLVRMALDMHQTVARIARERQVALAMRIGLASGPIMAGVIGKQKFTYDVWGDAVNLAARLENLSQPGRILVCPRCRQILGDEFAFESRGQVDIKGVGLQETWFLSLRPEA